VVFFDVENSSRAEHVAFMLDHLGLPDPGVTKVVAMGNWRVVSLQTARLLAKAGAELVHSAPVPGVKDWSDLRIAAAVGVWLGAARAADTIEVVTDDQAFDAAADVAAARGVVFRRLSLRAIAREGGPVPTPSRQRAARGRPRTPRRRSRR
jgi:hypothetical protein